jgi:hypothetical protein
MKNYTLPGALLVIVGLLALVYQGITYTTRETVLDIGPLHATADRQRTVPLPPLVGGAAVAVGGLLIALSVRKRIS